MTTSGKVDKLQKMFGDGTGLCRSDPLLLPLQGALRARQQRFLSRYAELEQAGGLLGASVMLLFGAQAPSALPYVIAFAAGNFLYVAMADLIPTLHHSGLDKNATRQLILIGLGIATMALL